MNNIEIPSHNVINPLFSGGLHQETPFPMELIKKNLSFAAGPFPRFLSGYSH